MIENHPQDSRIKIDESGKCQTLSSRMGTGGGNVPMVMEIENMTKKIVRRLTPLECERLQGYPDNWTLIGEPDVKWVKNKEIVVDDADVIYDDDEINPSFLKILEQHTEERPGYHKEIVYYYTDSNGKRKEVTDSNRYRALGNSLALPQWFWLVNKMKPHLRENATLGSLFDGIGGFPLVWEETYGKGTARWASEIEEFPIAVTKERFPESE